MFNQSQLAARPSGLYNQNEPRSSRGIFANAGLSISGGNDDSIQHNYRYGVDREKLQREAEAAEISRLKRFQSEANFETMSRANPTAFKSYSNNLQRISHNVNSVDNYANEVQNAKERLFQDQQNVLNLQKLNRLNADQHKQHNQSQLLRIREPVRNKDFPPFRAHPRSGNSIDSRTHISDTDADLKMGLLDKFSANNGLDDPLSAFGHATGAMTGRSAGPDVSRDFGDMSRYMGTNERRAPTSTFYHNASAQGSPLLPQHQSPYMQQAFNPAPVPVAHSQFYQPPPGYGFNPPAPSNENNEIKNYMQQQTALLERLSDKINKRKDESRQKSRRDTRQFETRLKDFEKETELRLQLMKQQQTIETLQTQASQPRQKPEESRQSRYRQREQPKSQNQDPYMPHALTQSQPDLFSPQVLAQNFMQYMNPMGNTANPLLNPYMAPSYDAYLNAYAYGAYPDNPYNMFSPYPYSSRSKKEKKKKRKKSTKKRKSDSSDESNSDSEKSDSDESDDGHKSRSKSKHKKARDGKDKKSKDKKKDKNKGKDKDQPSEEERKKKAISNLKAVLWAIAYQKIFKTDISQKVVRRKAAHQQHVNEGLDPFAQNFATWFMNVTQEGFTKLFDDAKKTYDFVGLDFKKPGKSDIVKRATEAKKQTKFLLDVLVSKTDANVPEIKEADLEFLAGISYGNIYVSDGTFSTFELQRMKWNYWGRNTEMTKEQSQMIIGALLIIRIFTYQLIFKANEWNTKTKWTPQALANFKIVGSLIYRIAYSLFEEIPVVSEKPSEIGYHALPNLTIDSVMAPVDDNIDNPEMIFGAVTKAQLAAVLDEDKPWVDSVKALIWGWTEKMHQIVADYRAKNPAKEPVTPDDDPRDAGDVI